NAFPAMANSPPLGDLMLTVGAIVSTVKLASLVATSPDGPVTEILPVVAPTGTVAAMLAACTTLESASTPLNWTLVAPSNVVPVMVTIVPGLPATGEKLLILGITKQSALLLPVPDGVVTEIFP